MKKLIQTIFTLSLLVVILIFASGCATVQNALGTTKQVLGEAADAKLINDAEGLCENNSVGAIYRHWTPAEYKEVRKALGCKDKQ